MKKVISIGEMLIDFIPKEKGCGLKDVENFIKMPGGAPANVCVSVSRLGGQSKFIGQVGNDGFGKFLKNTLLSEGVDTEHVFQTNKAHTALAFVTLTDQGERDFAFYRNPSADQILDRNLIKHIDFKNSIYHFCSLSLDDYPLKDAVEKSILRAKKQNSFISFDPNLRLSLFNDHRAYQKVILEFIEYADLLKVSDDELFFITKIKDEKKAIDFLFLKNIKYLILTRGKDGVSFYSKDTHFDVKGYQVEVKDTTGAGDAWIGSFLYQLSQKDDLSALSETTIKDMLKFSNATAALTTTNLGAMTALPTLEQVQAFMKKSENM
jgi:fructokinase